VVAEVDDRLGALRAILFEIFRLQAVDSDGNLLAFKIRGTEKLTRVVIIDIWHWYFPCICIYRRHLIRRRRRRFPGMPGNGRKIVSSEPPPRHAPSNRPAPALSGFPSSERVHLFRRGLC